VAVSPDRRSRFSRHRGQPNFGSQQPQNFNNSQNYNNNQQPALSAARTTAALQRRPASSRIRIIRARPQHQPQHNQPQQNQPYSPPPQQYQPPAAQPATADVSGLAVVHHRHATAAERFGLPPNGHDNNQGG
jgi:hypothetical protein